MTSPIRIAVIGAGAMGSVFGALLARAGHAVHLYDRDRERVAAATSLSITTPQESFTISLAATDDSSSLHDFDLALVFLDSNATATVAPLVPAMLAPAGIALTLQNGIGNVEALSAALGIDRVIGGSSYMSAAMPAPGEAANSNSGPTVIGEAAGGPSSRADGLAALLSAAGIATTVSMDVMGVIWSKFVHNCALNPLSALTRLRPGEVARQPAMSALLNAATAEILAVVAAKGIRLPEDDPARHIREHAFLRYNKPSMLQHIEARRRSEIAALNGALVREAEALGVPVPVNRTIAALVEGLDACAERGETIDEKALEAAAAVAFNATLYQKAGAC